MEEEILYQTEQELLDFDDFKKNILRDYLYCYLSREVSIIGRKEVMNGKAKFGIFGSGMEVPQVVMAKYFQKGDWRSGYYRDQTFMFAKELSSIEDFFAQLYADHNNDPFSGGRQMNAHFASQVLDSEGNWLDLINRYNVSADLAPTAGQMVRALGLAFASKCFRGVEQPENFAHLSNNGNEVCFCTIGDASTSEGQFWETINAAAVLRVPLVVFIWDNGYGISVPTSLQTVKGSISEALSGFEMDDNNPHQNGLKIYKAKGWDYPNLCNVFKKGIDEAREHHIPIIFHIDELTQPLGHSTSGSHERYKSKERIDWEKEWDCLAQMRQWILDANIIEPEQLIQEEKQMTQKIVSSKEAAWVKYQQPFRNMVDKLSELCYSIQFNNEDYYEKAQTYLGCITEEPDLNYKTILQYITKIVLLEPNNHTVVELSKFKKDLEKIGYEVYAKHLYFENPTKNIISFPKTQLTYHSQKKIYKNGYEILNIFFKELFYANPAVFTFGEDVGFIGDVNQGMVGLQKLFGELRVFDTGIREQSIVGQAIGMALRGLKPIAEIQYLDYLVYALQTLCDDVATLHYRSNGIQCNPIIIRTRGHRLEGIWHSGSPMGMLLNSLQGIRLCVPRNMIQAVGMYNTLLKGNDPGIVIECLNAYRLKELIPDQNLIDYYIPLGHPDIIREGEDITIVSYGSVLRIIEDAAQNLQTLGISCEIIDVQTLNPFDVSQSIVESLKKTNRILFIDEDVSSGATAFMFKQVMEVQNGYKYLDAKPRCLSGTDHRPAFGNDGDYFSKPNEENIIEMVIQIVKE